MTTTKTPGQQLDALLLSAKQEYDELKLKIHLADMEAKREWEGLQDRWLRFRDDCHRVIEDAKKSGSRVDDSLHAVGEEFKAAFNRIKEACKA